MTQKEWRSIFIPRVCPRIWPIFELPWFSRLWVFQEVVLSRRCTIVFGPNTTLSWKDLEDGACLLGRFPRAPHGLSLTRSVRIESAYSGTGKAGSSLLQLVTQHVEQECTDPRDYIFGLLGLTLWANRRLRFPDLIQPSYVKPVSDCMRDATRVMLQQEGNLSALLHLRQFE